MKNQNIKFAWRQFNELSSNEIYEILHLRQKVFIVEQDCPYIDADFSDQEAWHYLGYEGKKLISYLRVFPPGIKYDDKRLEELLLMKVQETMVLANKLLWMQLLFCKIIILTQTFVFLLNIG